MKNKSKKSPKKPRQLQSTSKKISMPVPIIVALIGLVGTLVISFPSLLNMGKELISSDEAPLSPFIRYDDPSGGGSLEYPEGHGVEERSISKDTIFLKIYPLNSTPLLDTGFRIISKSESGIHVYCGLEEYSLSNDEFIVNIQEFFLESGYEDLLLVTNKETDNGYIAEYETSVDFSRRYIFVLYEKRDDAFILIMLDGVDLKIARRISEHVFSSVKLNPLELVEFFKSQ